MTRRDPDVGVELRRLADIEEIKRLKASYCRLVDTKQWDAWKELMVDDFRLEGDSGVDEGRDAVVAMVSRALADASTVHRVFAPEIVITGPDSATAIWGMEDQVRLVLDGTPIAFRGSGHYHEEYVRTAAGWRMKRSLLERLRTDPIHDPEPASDG